MSEREHQSRWNGAKTHCSITPSDHHPSPSPEVGMAGARGRNPTRHETGHRRATAAAYRLPPAITSRDASFEWLLRKLFASSPEWTHTRAGNTMTFDALPTMSMRGPVSLGRGGCQSEAVENHGCGRTARLTGPCKDGGGKDSCDTECSCR